MGFGGSMVGLIGYGCYVPRGRVSRASMAEAWGGNAGLGGDRAAAGFDEDAITLAVEACTEALIGVEARSIGALYFASTTSPFGEKSAADLVAGALDLRSEVFTAEFCGSSRAWLSALRAAHDAVKAGSVRSVLVVGADVRTAAPGSSQEALLGDAAAAVVVGTGEILAEIETLVSMSGDFSPVWRLTTDRFLMWDDFKVAAEAYVEGTLHLVRRLLEVSAREPGDIQRAIVSALDPGSYRALVKASGMADKFDPRPLLEEVGASGVSSVPLQLCAALQGARAGDRLLLAAWAGGGDGMVLHCTEAVGRRSSRRRVDEWVGSRALLPYFDYLRGRELVFAQDGPWDFSPFASLTMARRESRQNLRLYAQLCAACGAIAFPARPACGACGASGEFNELKLAHRGQIATWNRDHVFPGPGSPLVNVVVDLDGGGRLLTQLTEGEPAIGGSVELCLRKLHMGRGMPHYWWKARTPRGVAASELEWGAVP